MADSANVPGGLDGFPVTIAVASGKGGTGKTLVSTNLALAAARSGRTVALVDCDADAPNAALFLQPVSVMEREVTVPLPVIDATACSLCGACRKVCAFGAIRILGEQVLVFPELCHGCGACRAACPKGAIQEVAQRVGVVASGEIRADLSEPGSVDVVTGTLDIGNVKAPPVIRAARKHAERLDRDVTFLDAPPGVACAPVAAIHGADALVLVTEPTPFGLHDLKLAVELGKSLGIPMGVVINRDGSGDVDVSGYCEAEGLNILAKIPFDRTIAEIYADGGLVLDDHPSGAAWFSAMWPVVEALVRKEMP